MPRGVRFGQAVADAVVRRTAAGESLPQIARDAGMPAADTVRHWIGTRRDFADQMAAAREVAGAPLRGRPPLWCVETAEEIVRRVAGGETLNDVCRDPALPSVGTVHTWKKRYPEFKEAMDQAYEIRAERLADDGMKLALSLAREGWGQGVEPGRAYACDVMLRYVKWYAARLGPRRWAARKAAEAEADPRRVDLIVKTFKIGVGADGEPTVYAIAPNPETRVVERVDEGKWPGVEGAKGFVGKPGDFRGPASSASGLPTRAGLSPSPLPSPSPLRGGRGEDPEGWL